MNLYAYLTNLCLIEEMERLDDMFVNGQYTPSFGATSGQGQYLRLTDSINDGNRKERY